MMLFKHPREARKNKESAGRLINKWSRPILGLNDNFKNMSRRGDYCGDAACFGQFYATDCSSLWLCLFAEREEQDLENMPRSKRRRLTLSGIDFDLNLDAPKPGKLCSSKRDFAIRVRVPEPSNKNYVIRPRWNVASNDDGSERPISKPSKSRNDERFKKHRRNFVKTKKNLKMQRAVGISIDGNKMALSWSRLRFRFWFRMFYSNS